MTDDRGVLGNLPHSRPGRRSDKRTHEAKPPRRTPPKQAEHSPQPTRSSDPVSEAIRTATGVAAVGARVANGLARELVRRLPRP
jgi:hypothetical protein